MNGFLISNSDLFTSLVNPSSPPSFSLFVKFSESDVANTGVCLEFSSASVICKLFGVRQFFAARLVPSPSPSSSHLLFHSDSDRGANSFGCSLGCCGGGWCSSSGSWCFSGSGWCSSGGSRCSSCNLNLTVLPSPT